jgi:hypothetical protein
MLWVGKIKMEIVISAISLNQSHKGESYG